MILSVSRRTDIPAFYPEWFMRRVHAGDAYVKGVFNANLISRIPLTPEVVDCIVFWTKNPEPLMKYLPEIADIYNNSFYFQFTVNAYDKDMEPNVPPLEKRIETFREIAVKYGKERVVWRYDPIFLSDRYTVEWHLKEFSKMFEMLRDYTDTCVISFLDMYDKTGKNTRADEIRVPNEEEMNLFAKSFSEIAKDSGVVLKTCAEAIDLSIYNILPNSCIDKERIELVSGYEIKAKKDKQRELCQCIECADIGSYDTCKHGCKYCYATHSPERVKKAIDEHSDDSPLLSGTIGPKCEIKDYSKGKSLKIGLKNNGVQTSFF